MSDEIDPLEFDDTKNPFDDLDTDYDPEADAYLDATFGEHPPAEKPSPEAVKEEVAPEPVFSTLDEFVTDYLLFFYRRRITANRGAWCPQWWRHPEAHLRLNELWRLWEHLRLDEATGVATWLRDFADPFMNVLLSPAGPMAGCTPEGHSTHMTLEPLPTEPAPDDRALAALAIPEGDSER